MIDKNANGCIMADGMGLGKTVWPDKYCKSVRVTDKSSSNAYLLCGHY